MSTINTGSKRKLFFAALIGAAISYGAHYFILDDSEQSQKIISLESNIKNLEAELADKEKQLMDMRILALRQNSNSGFAKANTVTEICKQVKDGQFGNAGGDQTFVDAPLNGIPQLKDLETHSVNDQRSFADKVNDLLSNNPSKEKIAIATKGIYDLAGDRESLPDYALQSMYTNQTDPELKRVLAQTLSLRGNNVLLDTLITESQQRLNSEKPAERQNELQNLAKTHSVDAVKTIEPLLQDSDINVKLEALLALGATGNQSHIYLVEKLLKDPDPAVSSLANDVAKNLKNLSDSARTTIASSDIAAELPRIDN